MMVVVTGAAGFIGSRLLAGLNRIGVTEILAVDELDRSPAKSSNLYAADIADYLDRREFLAQLESGRLDGSIDAILHQGACSDTMETDGRYMLETNYGYSKALLDWCQDEEVPLIYASSASVYGAGREFAEARENERPLNVYAYSKFLFDQYVRRRASERTAQVAGLRYFNVYGPNEAHKGRMASVAFHHFGQFQSQGHVALFGEYDGYGPGAHERDFVWVGDVVDVNLWLLEHAGASGIFKVGSGRAEPFNAVAAAMLNSCRVAGG